MGGNDFVWVGSIIIGITLVGWLVLDWLESAQDWESFEDEGRSGAQVGMGNPERHLDPLDAELELMLCYPLDPFAPSLLWQPLPAEEWQREQRAEAQIASSQLPELTANQPALLPGQADLV